MVGLQKRHDLNNKMIETSPIGTDRFQIPKRVPKEMIDLAYEVYCHLYGVNENKINEHADSYVGFTLADLIVLLYVHNFPKEDWTDRYLEAGQQITWA